MDIIIYRNVSPPNVIKKKNNYGELIVDSKQGQLVQNVRFIEKGALDILNPELLLNITDDIGNVSQYNYVKIPKFNRFYYIDSINTEGGLVRFKCRVDVLMSHSKDILNSTQYILRQEKYNNSPYLDDNMLPIRSDHNYLAKPFGSYVDDRTCAHVIMATTGKGGTIV